MSRFVGRSTLLSTSLGAVLVLAGCPSATQPVPETPATVGPRVPPPAPTSCGTGAPMRVHFYDVGQGLAALVDLPDGRHVLVDTGEAPTRGDCGKLCAGWHERFTSRLTSDLGGAPIDLVWISHPHSDHLGGALDVLGRNRVHHYVDNGRDPERADVRKTREQARANAVEVSVVDPDHREVPLRSSNDVRLSAIVPRAWSSKCKSDANECSILLRIDYCASSVLFTGDAEADEERTIDVGGPVTLLQVAHHGSTTSTTDRFLDAVKPRYAVISSGHPSEGPNSKYCHPRASVVRRLTRHIGGTTQSMRAYDADKCRAGDEHWVDVPASDRVWATSRDGDVVLTTTGDGAFVRQP